MNYHKINTVFKRDEEGRLLEGEWTHSEFEYLKLANWQGTEKVDGMNIVLTLSGDNLRITGRTENAQIPAQLSENINATFAIDVIAKIHKTFNNRTVTMYGEGYGPKIQSGGKYGEEQDFVLFDVLISEKYFLCRKDVEAFGKAFGIKVVPILREGTLLSMIDVIKSRELKSSWGDFLPEGLVLRPKVEMRTQAGERIITKLKHKDFITR